MSPDKSDKRNIDRQSRKSKDRAAEIANTFEWLITAFILAFVFRAFVMEAFRIPTGSMADTLMGAPFRLRCRQCGYKYNHGFVPRQYRLPEDTVPSGNTKPPLTRCPSCGHFDRTRAGMPVANGDRILVLKCIYQYLEPKRWDVIVFKNPPEPTINYIKRLVGLPGESVQIIDGDIYIDGQISRKPAKVQNELWMPVYDNDYQPVAPREGFFNGHTWEQPFKNIRGSKWITEDRNNPTIFRLDSPDGGAGQINSLVYDTSIGNDFRATYAYDQVDEYESLPYCSDLMVRFTCRAASSQGRIGISLSKYQTNYKAWIDLTGEMVIARQENGKQSIELARMSIELPAIDQSNIVKFANVDHRLIFEFGGKKLTFDLGHNLEDVGAIQEDVEPRVEIFGSGKITLSHIAIFRDIHYTQPRFISRKVTGRATKDNPFVLEEDQFFVLGDNSPNSQDGRWWERPGVANKGLPEYREGTVPRDYLVGKAMFVYWPSGFKPFAEFPFGIGIIPNIGRMRLIYGGSNGSD